MCRRAVWALIPVTEAPLPLVIGYATRGLMIRVWMLNAGSDAGKLALMWLQRMASTASRRAPMCRRAMWALIPVRRVELRGVRADGRGPSSRGADGRGPSSLGADGRGSGATSSPRIRIDERRGPQALATR